MAKSKLEQFFEKKYAALAAIILFGFLLRALFLSYNYENKGRYFGHSLNAADMAIQFVIHKRIGVFDQAYRDVLHGAAISNKKLIDPEDLKPEFARIVPGGLVADFENEPGLGALMGVVWLLTADMRFIYIQFIQLFIDLLCIYLVFTAAINIFDSKKIALTSAFFYAIFPIQIYLVTFPAPYPWMVFYGIIMLYLLSIIYGVSGLYISSSGKKIMIFMLIGLMTGLFTYIRSIVILFPVFLCVSLCLFKERIRRGIVYGGIMLSIMLLSLLPLFLRNYYAFDQVRAIRGNFWHSVWGGWGAHENPWGIIYTDDAVAGSVLREYPEIEKYGPEYEGILKRRSLNAIRERPLWFIKLFSERIIRFVFPVAFTAEGQSFFSVKKALFTIPLFVVGALGGILAIKKRYSVPCNLLIFSVPTLYFFFITILVAEPTIKYVYPGYVFLLMLCAISIVEACRKCSKIFSGAS